MLGTLQSNWFGNIRELKNTLERTVALSGGDTIQEIKEWVYLKMLMQMELII